MLNAPRRPPSFKGKLSANLAPGADEGDAAAPKGFVVSPPPVGALAPRSASPMKRSGWLLRLGVSRNGTAVVLDSTLFEPGATAEETRSRAGASPREISCLRASSTSPAIL